MATESSARMRTARSYIGHFETLDGTLLASLLTPDYEHVMAPASLGMPSMTRDGFLAHSAGLRRVLSGFPVAGRRYLESEGANAVVVWATSRAVFREEIVAGLKGEGEEGDWEYEGEYVFMFEMSEDGTRVRRCVEFLDSKKTDGGIRVLMRRAREWVDRVEGVGRE